MNLAQIQIEKSFLTTAFSILEEQAMDMLLGLDILKRFLFQFKRLLFIFNLFICLLYFLRKKGTSA